MKWGVSKSCAMIWKLRDKHREEPKRSFSSIMCEDKKYGDEQKKKKRFGKKRINAKFYTNMK